MILTVAFLALTIQSAEPGRLEAIVRVRLLAMDDDLGVIDDATVILEDGVVLAAGRAADVEVPDGAIIIDGLGRTLLPGLVDAHVHLDGGGSPRLDRDPETAARASLRFGVTAVLDLNCAESVIFDLRSRERSDSTATLPHLFVAGSAFSLPGGHGTEGGYPARLLASGEDPTPLVRELATAEADWLKIMVDGGGYGGEPQRPSLSDGDVERIIAAAHALKMRVAVHAVATERARAAIEAGADLLTHVPFLGEIDDQFIALLVVRQTLVLPTLAAYEAQASGAMGTGVAVRDASRAAYFSERMPGLLATISRMHAAGVRLVPGSDAGMPGVFHGAALHAELAALARAGIPLETILTRATRDAAGWVLNAESLGRVTLGLPANLLLVDGNPLLRLGDLARVVAVWKRGVRVPDAILVDRDEIAVAAPFRERRRIVDFESEAPPLLRLASELAIARPAPNAGGEAGCVGSVIEERNENAVEHFLRISGRRGGRSPFALDDGIAIDLAAVLQPDVLSQFRALRFRVRGDSVERCRVLLLPRTPRDSDHHGRTIAIGKEYATVELPFEEFSQVGYGDRRRLDLGAVVAFGFCPLVENDTEYRIDLDDFELVR